MSYDIIPWQQAD